MSVDNYGEAVTFTCFMAACHELCNICGTFTSPAGTLRAAASELLAAAAHTGRTRTANRSTFETRLWAEAAPLSVTNQTLFGLTSVGYPRRTKMVPMIVKALLGHPVWSDIRHFMM